MIRLLLVEDSITQREILCSLIDRSGEFVIVAEGRNGREAVALVEKYQPETPKQDSYFLKEVILWALAENKKLSKFSLGNGLHFKDLYGSYINGL